MISMIKDVLMSFLTGPNILYLLIIVSLSCMAVIHLAVRRKRVLLIPLLGGWIVLIASLVIGTLAVHFAVESTKAALKCDLQGIAKAFAVTLQEMDHASITPAMTSDDPRYKSLLDVMVSWQERLPRIASVFTLRENGVGQAVFVLSPGADLNRDGVIAGEKEQQTPNGELYPDEDYAKAKELQEAFQGKSSFSDKAAPDSWGYWVTAAEPMFDRGGKHVEAVLGVDFGGDVWDSEIVSTYFYTLLFFFLYLVLFFVVVIFLVERQALEDRMLSYAIDLEGTVDELLVEKHNTLVTEQTKGYFLAQMVRELQKPLDAVLNYCEKRERDQEKATGASEATISGLSEIPEIPDLKITDIPGGLLKDMMVVLDDILTFSKIDLQRVILESIPIDLRQLIEEVQTTLQEQLGNNPKIQCRVDISQDVPVTILGDPVRLRQVLLYLAGNAVKFTEEGFIDVRLSVWQPESKNTEFGVSKDGKSVVRRSLRRLMRSSGVIQAIDQVLLKSQTLSSVIMMSGGLPVLRFDIADTGVGLSPAQIQHLFEPFSQFDLSSRQSRHYTGLGLGIVRSLAQLMGGNILVESELGKGSTFSVYIPCRLLETTSMSPDAFNTPRRILKDDVSDPPLPLSHRRILIASDAVVAALVMEAKLLNAGAAVEIASNGNIVMKRVQAAEKTKTPYDVILMSMDMPIMDGITATRELRAKGVPVPIIALISDPNEGNRTKTIGCNSWLVQPFSSEELIRKILECLG
ncbi:hypothetical protein FACS189454_03590 [Planctomycetales bacterium]|nr:hypothetical protein FACS189454_03590 [Planctomycetales bacterium]